ncbi:hypothetical protein A2773_07080 [Candidatus Gottesmanbacteria bacterium RIFCSPHIGHO2_01_FULL_39_10]|uniref:Phosphoribosyltransferase domain-containing protein n=1 Tax=Candidatus Gottesmanbacteria bacterium RIFCSPHIGHO2_01_FULL_39_10 TaxID=1798375 RepID=A0A1F5ZR28_9BACT|nr:MAG: hypothetical protein A2773_07080 [Candidatus Gottesmanbacteria bacterium RIFCSPHIGHO2_01_FULL_39_10]
MFENRKEAGQLLAQKLKAVAKKLKFSYVFAIPRGGVVVGDEIAQVFHIPLRVLIVKKIGAPYNSEMAIGAIASNNFIYKDNHLIERLGIGSRELKILVEEKEKEIIERQNKYQVSYPKSLKGKKVILTDDGIATGATTKAAIAFLKSLKAKKILLAVPVISEESYRELIIQVESIIALMVVDNFGSVGQFYREFEQVSDNEVIKLLSN